MDRGLTFSQCDEWLKIYHENYRHPSLEMLKFSACYLLYETSLRESAPLEIEPLLISHWPKSWVDAGKCGVYLIFDETFDVIYIGKTSGSRGFEHRPACYFSYDKSININPDEIRRCTPRKQWEKLPYGFVTIPVREPFEAPSLEEYLITMAAKKGVFLLNKVGFRA